MLSGRAWLAYKSKSVKVDKVKFIEASVPWFSAAITDEIYRRHYSAGSRGGCSPLRPTKIHARLLAIKCHLNVHANARFALMCKWDKCPMRPADGERDASRKPRTSTNPRFANPRHSHPLNAAPVHFPFPTSTHPASRAAWRRLFYYAREPSGDCKK